MKKIINVAEPCIGKKEIAYATACLRSGWISSLGAYITKFEEKFAAYCRMPYGVTTSNGTTALHLALAVLGVGPGDEVIVPDLTFIAVPNAVRYTGATPVFVDSERDTWNMDPALIEQRITPRTKAIIAVHLYGHPADIGAVAKIARRHRLALIEDCAEAHGALFKGRKTGSFGDISCFSFYGNKIITLGEGGILLMKKRKLYDRARFLRDHGMSKTRRYFHPETGFNYRITNLQCAVGLAQLEQMDRFIERKRENAFLYNRLLKDVEGISLPPEKEWAKNVYWMYSVLSGKRDALARHLRKNGIDTRPFFIPMHRQPPYLEKNGRYPVTDDLSRRGMNLPSSVRLTKKDIRFICDTVKQFHTKKAR